MMEVISGPGVALIDLANQLEGDDSIKAAIIDGVNNFQKQMNDMEENARSFKRLVDAKEDEIISLAAEKVIENEKKIIYIEKELRDQQKIAEGEEKKANKYISNYWEEKESLTKKISDIEKENKRLQESVLILSEGILADKCRLKTGCPDTEAEIKYLRKTLDATEALFQLKKAKCQKADVSNAELSIRLELEHDRRIRAQNVIDEIEREKVHLKNQIDMQHTNSTKKLEQFEELKLSSELKMGKMIADNKRIESIIIEKDKKILEMQQNTKELSAKVDELDALFNNQTDTIKTMQNELSASYEENKALVNEMEMLNEMFEEMEHGIHVREALDGYNCENIEVYKNGKKVKVQVSDLLKMAATEEIMQESCFKEVTTKNGTRMILSVSKTFMKLKDLILEKKTLEDQLDKMKSINDHLCSQVNVHERKLCNITDELNSTWFYVSKIKEQHKMLHNSEQILRAELSEKRQLLTKLRHELEETRLTWKVVKQKTADSEKQWRALRDEFAERRKLIWPKPSESESGFSEADTEDSAALNESESDTEEVASMNEVDADTEDAINQVDEEESTIESFSVIDECHPVTIPIDIENIDPLYLPVGTPEVVIASGIADIEDDDDDEEIPDPFPDEIDETESIEDYNVDGNEAMGLSTTTITDEDNVAHETPIFVPSMSFMSQIPASLHPHLFPTEKDHQDFQHQYEMEGAQSFEHCDGNIKDLITRLMSSSARSAFLASSLSDLHRRIVTGQSIDGDWIDDDDDTDIDPRDTEDEDIVTHSPDVSSDLETDDEINERNNRRKESQKTDAIYVIPPPPPQPSYSLKPPTSNITVRPTYDQVYDEDVDDQKEHETRESSMSVAKFLIKHLPKQLSKLRNEKSELEDKIHDLESTVSDQRGKMAEHERRVEAEKNKSQKLEERLTIDEEKKRSSIISVTVAQEDETLLWTIISLAQTEKEDYLPYSIKFTPTGELTTEEITPISAEVTLSYSAEQNPPSSSSTISSTPQCSHVHADSSTEVLTIPSPSQSSSPTMATSLRTPCPQSGLYTLKLKGDPDVTLSFKL